MTISENVEIHLPEYAEEFFPHKRFKGIEGGRGSAKTSTVAIIFVMFSYREECRLLCGREVQKSMKQSSYMAIKKAVYKLMLQPFFDFQVDKIVCRRTKSEFMFNGLSGSSIDQVLSMEGIKYVWIEQAESISERSLKLLTPTIRENGSEIWATWNPRNSFDPIQKFFKTYEDEAIVRHVNYYDNPFFPQALELERKICELRMPSEYPHIWLGEFQEIGEQTVLPYMQLKQCVGAHKKLNYDPSNSLCYFGLDVADGGKDKPAVAIRKGALVTEARELGSKNGYEIVEAIFPEVVEQKAVRVYYDATGVGASVKSELFRMNKFNRLPFVPEGFLFGGKVQGGQRLFCANITNQQYFSRLNAQGFWNLRLRLNSTLAALRGETSVPLESCLFFDESVPDAALQELAQITYDRDNSNRLRIDKAPGSTQSPNLADAIMMSFARDLIRGLKIRC